MKSKNAKMHDNSQYFFQLSGIHDELPAHELISIFKSEQIPQQKIKQYTGCLVNHCSEQEALRATQRAAYCRRSVKLLLQANVESKTISEIANEISEEVDFKEHIPVNSTFLVRVYRIQKASIQYISEKLERAIGRNISIQLEGKISAKMKNPDETFILLFSDEQYFFGQELFVKESGFFETRRPDIRPFFKPGTLEPRFARLMANLSQANNSSYLLDPFCGPGGILIEGALMDCPVIGMDIDKRMIAGAKKNLAHFTPNGTYEFLIGDARTIPFENTIKAIATDPPYGRSTSTYGKVIIDLLDQFFSGAHQVLTNDGYIAVGMFQEIPIQDIAEANNFQLEIFEKIYIHKSLTRRVGVFRKK
ncbi:MAG TPA: TRM11 family methyltransferase [Candidatus Bathyarchaeia archaeon]|nr:TRM11 family methyltransferase [Candidatus Bathyarchaeia archaeon]